MKIKVDFNKLVWGYYRLFHLDIELAMINWLFKTGLQGDGYQERHGWYRSGINQLLYGYSGNDELYHTESFPIHDTDVLDGFIRSIFVRAFLAPYSSDGFRSKIDLWREKNKIDITKYRYLDFPQRSSNNTREFLLKISEYQGSELKRHLFHPELTGRSHPKITWIKLSTCGEGYFVEIDFSFWEFNYKPGWTYLVAKQDQGEYIADFLKRAEQELKRITINTTTRKRLQFETENHLIDYTEKNCGNCTWLKEKNEKIICHLMELYGIKQTVIKNKYGYCCDEWKIKDYSHVKDKPADA